MLMNVNEEMMVPKEKEQNPGGPLVSEVGYHPRKKITQLGFLLLLLDVHNAQKGYHGTLGGYM